MARVLVSANLNVYGNAGAFETDRSTWGFGNGNATITRSSAQKSAGLYSALVKKDLTITDNLLIPCAWPGEVGKTYVIRAKVRTPTGALIAAGADDITLQSSISDLQFGLTEIDFINKTVTLATDAFVDIELAVTASSASLGPNYLAYVKIDGTVVLNGQLYVDELEVYEFIDDADPEPDPEEETDGIYFSRNPITLNKTATAGWDELENFRMHDDVRIEETADSGTYVSALKIQLTPFTNGTVVFQVREAFRKILTATPPNGVTTIERLTDRIKKFKHYTGEVDGTDEDPASTVASVPHLVLMGGLSKYKYAEIDFFGTYLPANKNFMTWAPTTKPVDRNQDDYLNYFVFDPTTTSIKLKIVAYFDDDTDETETVITKTGVLPGHLYQIPAGPSNSGALLVNPAKTLTKYDLSILDQGDALISEVRTYVLDAFTHPRKRLFMFLNSLGSYEIMRFTGQSETSVDVSKEEIVKFLPATYDQADGEREVNNATMRTQGSYSSGLFNDENASAWLNYMQDFLLSKRVYLIDGTNLIPVVVSGGSFAMNADQVYEKSIRFTAVNSYQEENYTPEDI